MANLDWSVYELVNGRLSGDGFVELHKLLLRNESARERFWEWIAFECALYDYFLPRRRISDVTSEHALRDKFPLRP